MENASRYEHLIARCSDNFFIADGQLELAGHDGHKFVRRMDKIIPLSAGRIGEQVTGVASPSPVTGDLVSVGGYREFMLGKIGHGYIYCTVFVCASEYNGVAERFIRTLKELVLWVQTFLRPLKTFASPFTTGSVSITSSGWSSAMDSVHQLRRGGPSWRCRQPHEDTAEPEHLEAQCLVGNTRCTPLAQERRSSNDATHLPVVRMDVNQYIRLV
jgi:hypothetical protein